MQGAPVGSSPWRHLVIMIAWLISRHRKKSVRLSSKRIDRGECLPCEKYHGAIDDIIDEAIIACEWTRHREMIDERRRKPNILPRPENSCASKISASQARMFARAFLLSVGVIETPELLQMQIFAVNYGRFSRDWCNEVLIWWFVDHRSEQSGLDFSVRTL